nr:VOC family protein [Kribbella sandramycini]
MHHLGILVPAADFDAMINFYSAVLDMEVTHRGGPGGGVEVCFLTNDDQNHRIVFVTNPALLPQAAGEHSRLAHTAHEFPTIDGLLAKYAGLRDQGIFPYEAIDHGPTLSIYYKDPGGYSIELQVDSFGDAAKSTDFMQNSEVYRENLSGILFDPEAVIEERRTGRSLEEIHLAAYQGAYPPTAEQRARLAGGIGRVRGAFDHPSWGDDHPTFAGLDS